MLTSDYVSSIWVMDFAKYVFLDYEISMIGHDFGGPNLDFEIASSTIQLA